jgi:hypothetical protein
MQFSLTLWIVDVDKSVAFSKTINILINIVEMILTWILDFLVSKSSLINRRYCLFCFRIVYMRFFYWSTGIFKNRNNVRTFELFHHLLFIDWRWWKHQWRTGDTEFICRVIRIVSTKQRFTYKNQTFFLI